MTRRTTRAGLTLALLSLAAGAPVASGAPALVERYAELGWRPDERPLMPSVEPNPLISPAHAPAAAYPLRGPTTVRVEPGGGILVTEAMARRVVRLGARGRVTVIPDREPPWMPACPPQSAGSARIWADPVANQVFRATGPGTRTTIAGTGRTGFAGDGGPATAARLDQPTCAVRAAGGAVLVADRGNGRVRRIAPDGTISTVAGDGADMSPQELAAMPDGATLISDPPHARVLRLAQDGALTTVAGTGEPGWDGDGGPATRARLTMPWGLAVQADGGIVVSDFGSQTVRRISPAGTITTVLGAPPQRAAAPSRALRATVPARRRVAWWVSGNTGTSDEAASGRRAVIRTADPGGPAGEVRVVLGPRTFTWAAGDDDGCWGVARTRARESYAPGRGRYAPDLVHGRLVVARRLVTVGGRPEIGVPAWASRWDAQRVVEWVIDRPTGRVVATQSWAPWGLESRHRITPARGALAIPVTRPRGRGPQCERHSDETGSAYGFRDGIALARRVGSRLERVPALRVRMTARRSAGARVTASAMIALDRGRVRQELLRVAAPGPSRIEGGMVIGSHTALTTATGATLTQLRGEACWRTAQDGLRPDPSPATERVMPFEDAFFERPHRRGRLLSLRAYLNGLRVDSLIDPRDMRLVSQRWTAFDGRGRLTFRPIRSRPPLPAPEPRCPSAGAG
ncbi:MAG: hypothetical protein AB7U07_05210 [Thermoleophilia bacterium]